MNPLTQDDFSEITQLIAAARQRAVQAVNTALIDLYFSSNWGAISVLSAANIRCKWAGETSRWICCFSIAAKALLQAKLHEFYLQNAPDDYPEDPAGILQ